MSDTASKVHGNEPENIQQPISSASVRGWNHIIWSSVQPVMVLGTMTLVAAMTSFDWMDPKLFAAIMIVIPVPAVIIAERIWTKRKDWILEPTEMIEDAFWLACGALLWVPLYSSYYQTPVSDGFKAVRDLAPLQITIAPTSFLGLLGGAMVILLLSSFIYYWLHRIQHESLFWWRIHATHHHITKMGCMRKDRTHPLEWATLLIGTPTALALLGANDEVMPVVGAYAIWTGVLNHSNLPIRTTPIYDWVFATAPQHHTHHSCVRRQADSNYGCRIILWDRLFGTYCSEEDVEKIGAGKCVPLSIKEQLALAFYSKDRLKGL
ncbi:MAG: sterol desaturase family protein [Gammaproteobacteria bacterium]|nr:sterol desaturase family protein [Gammaproteobacteria bacterium]